MPMKTPDPQVLISVSRPAPMRIPLRAIRRLVPLVASAEGQRIGQIDIAIVGSDEMTGHNRRFLGHRGDTDVISFDLSGQDADPLAPPGRRPRTPMRAAKPGRPAVRPGRPGGRPRQRGGLYGQLIVCSDAAARQAGPHGLTPRNELLLYIVHGLLHLMGYDDLAVRAMAKMHARQDEILRAFLQTQ
jgi:probable rRNA maturation factor